MAGLGNLAKMITEAAKVKTPEQEFLHQFNEAYARLNPNRQPSKTYKPSSLGGCMRKVYFEVTGTVVDESFSDPSIAESGTARHEHMQGVVTRMQGLGYDCEWVDIEEFLKIHPQEGTRIRERKGFETKLYNEVLNMSFMCDGIIKFMGRYYILEIKTEASFKWQGRVQPEEKHIYQATCYAMCLGVDQVMFVYEGRDFCSRKTFLHEVTNQSKQDLVLAYVEECNVYVERNTVPPMTTKKSECTYCPFKGECKKWT